jgi:hypothetical protein
LNIIKKWILQLRFDPPTKPKSSWGAGAGDGGLVRSGGRGPDMAEKDINPPSIRNNTTTSTTKRYNNNNTLNNNNRGLPQNDESSEQAIRNAYNLDSFPR